MVPKEVSLFNHNLLFYTYSKEKIGIVVWRVRKQVNCDDEIHNVYSGKNISVAILDTGIFLHPDIEDRVVLFRDFIHNKKEPYDDCGHGTHVAGCLCGNGLLSKGRYKGISPGINLLVGKVLNETGNGKIEDTVKGLNWILENEKKYAIRILNISISFDRNISKEKVLILLKLLNKIHERGIIIVVAAGNHGPKVNSISPLGVANNVLCVGCYDIDLKHNNHSLCENYSGRGPGIFKIRKPDLVAPGTGIISLSCPKLSSYQKKNSFYSSRSGTSFATPLVSGAIALLLEKEPHLSSEEIRQRICFTATDLQEPWNKQGWGMLNISKLLDYRK